MTREELEALAARLVACPHFKPLPGMRDLQGRTWTPDLLWRWNRTIDRPDLSDPATMGCLLALVRAACGDPRATATASPYGDGRWGVVDSNALRFYAIGASEAEVLVAALEAAP